MSDSSHLQETSNVGMSKLEIVRAGSKEQKKEIVLLFDSPCPWDEIDMNQKRERKSLQKSHTNLEGGN